MSDFKVGDKVYFKSKILAIEGDNMYLVADRNGSRRFVAEDLTKTNELYNKGLNDAWELAKKIVESPSNGGYTGNELVEIFGILNKPVLDACTPQEAIAKVKEYEERDEIKVGDVVTVKGCDIKGLVTRVDGYNIYRLFRDGSCNGSVDKENLEKTGKHFDSIDEFMRSVDD